MSTEGVAATSLRRDLEIRTPIYARCGIPETWVIDVETRRLIGRRDPGAEGCRHVEKQTGGVVRAVRFERLRLDLASLWGHF